MKIGLLTLFYKNYNWGGVLQAYALKRYLESTNVNTQADVLRYESNTNLVYASRVSQISQYSFKDILNKLLERKNANRSILDNKLIVRNKLFDEFSFEVSPNSTVFNDETLKTASKEYDALICGSDQIWNPNVSRPGFYLTMIDYECKKISYAASIARDDLSPHERKVMIPLIERFDNVSVREKTAKNFLSKYTSKEIKEVLDPALLLPADEWSKIAADKKIKETYVLAFFFSESIVYRKLIEKYCEEQGFKLVFIPFAANKYIESDMQGECERLYDVGPKEFIRLFIDTKYVFTDSFHGSVFSILFKKNFMVFERDKKNKVSKNSRLYDLLDKFNLSNRLVRSQGEMNTTLKENINYANVYELLEKYRKESKDFLNEALGTSEI